MDKHELVLGLQRSEVSTTMDVAEATRPDPEDEDDETLAPFWRVSNGLGRREAQALSQRILGRAAARETMAPGITLPFAASSVLTTRPELGLSSCFHPTSHWSCPVACEYGPRGGRVQMNRPRRAFAF